jgi:C-terminal processing protease CtpA/Prc
LENIIPHENTYFLEALPQNWIVREDFLAFLGVLKDNKTVEVILERDGVILPGTSVPLMPNAATPDDDISLSFVSYEIHKEDATAIFTLNRCTFNQEYSTRLEEFWTAVKETDQIDTVVLDLRHNRGGDFEVAPAFLNHLAAATESYELFDVRQRQSEALCDQIPSLCASETLGFLQQLGVNTTSSVYDLPGSALSIYYGQVVGSPPTEKFDGKLYVLTSGQTFSSGHIFAGVVQANGLGELIGTPTGNAPNFWGNVISFPVPNTDLTFYSTTSLTTLSTVSNPEDAIYPDVLVETSLQDLQNGRDAQLDWVLTRNIVDITTEPSTPPSSDPDDSSAGIQTIHIGIVTSFLWLLM